MVFFNLFEYSVSLLPLRSLYKPWWITNCSRRSFSTPLKSLVQNLFWRFSVDNGCINDCVRDLLYLGWLSLTLLALVYQWQRVKSKYSSWIVWLSISAPSLLVRRISCSSSYRFLISSWVALNTLLHFEMKMGRGRMVFKLYWSRSVHMIYLAFFFDFLFFFFFVPI